MKKDELAWWLAEKLEPEPDCSPPIPAKQLDWNYEWASKLGFWTYWGGLDKNGEPMRRSVAPLDGNFATAVIQTLALAKSLYLRAESCSVGGVPFHDVWFVGLDCRRVDVGTHEERDFVLAVCLAAKAALESLDED